METILLTPPSPVLYISKKNWISQIFGCVYVFMCVSACTHRTPSGVSPCRPPCLRQGHTQAGCPQALRDSPSPTVSLTMRAPGLDTHTHLFKDKVGSEDLNSGPHGCSKPFTTWAIILSMLKEFISQTFQTLLPPPRKHSTVPACQCVNNSGRWQAPL